MQVTRLDTDMIALMILLEKNRKSILKILVDIGMPLEDENAEWEEIVDFALQYIAEKKAVGFFLYKLDECSVSPHVGADCALQSMWISAVLGCSNMEAVAEW